MVRILRAIKELKSTLFYLGVSLLLPLNIGFYPQSWNLHVFAQEVATDTIIESDIGADDSPGSSLFSKQSQILGALAALNDLIPEVQAEALYKLRELEAIKSIPEEKIPKIVALLEHNDSWVRRAAVEVLSELGEAGRVYFFQLTDLLQHEASEVRAAAVRVLSNLDTQGEVPLSQFKDLLHDPNPDIRTVAVRALGKQGDRAKDLIPEIVEMLKAKDWENRSAAADSLGFFGDVAQSEIPRIIALLQHRDWEVRSAAATTLGNLGVAVQKFLPQIETLLRNKDWEIRSAAAVTLGKLGTIAEPSIPKIAPLLKDESWNVRASAARALGDIGEPAAAYIPQITKLLQDREKNVRAAAAWTLGNLGKEAKPSIPRIVARLKDKAPTVRAAVVEALGKFGEDAEPYILQITDLLEDNDWEVRSAAATALGNLGINIEVSISKIASLLDDNDWYVRSSAARALGDIGEPAKEAIPKIAALLNDDDGNVRSAVVLVLGKFGDEAKKYRSEILTLLNDEHPGVRYSAIHTLGELSEASIKPVVSTLDPIYQDVSRTYEYRFLAHLIGAGKEEVETLLRWIGQPGDNYPKVEELSQEEARNTLEAFETAWGSTEMYPEVRNDLARQIAVVARARKGGWTRNDLALLETHLNNLNQINSAHAGALQEVIATVPVPAESEKRTPESQENLLIKLFRQIRTEISTALMPFLHLIRQIRAEISTTLMSFLHLIQVKQLLSFVAGLALCHLLFWGILLSLYPFSRKIQVVFFWNPYVRKILGLGYIHLLLTRVPFLGRRLFLPYQSFLLADAALEEFDEAAYFRDCRVKIKGRTDVLALYDAIPRIKGQIILEGESGSGKTMFGRSLLNHSKRVTAYLPAGRCTQGVVEAIQAKLHDVANDKAFLKKLISLGTIDICIDGLNEVSMTTQAKVLRFVQSEFKGNLLLLTQPVEWKPPATMTIYILQPLEPNQIAAFLVTCYPMLPRHLHISRLTYEQACQDYVADMLARIRSEEGLDTYACIFSNPMNLSTIALVGSYGKEPDPERVQEQLYQLMAERYARQHHGRSFPLSRFSEHAYWTRFHDKTMLYWEEFSDELHCMKQYNMVFCYQSVGTNDTPTRQWIFRHEKIMDFFVAQTFLGDENNRLDKHFRDPRFRGVYTLLATLLPPDAAGSLGEKLVRYASEVSDPVTSKMFIELYQNLCVREKTSMTPLMQGKEKEKGDKQTEIPEKREELEEQRGQEEQERMQEQQQESEREKEPKTKKIQKEEKEKQQQQEELQQETIKSL